MKNPWLQHWISLCSLLLLLPAGQAFAQQLKISSPQTLLQSEPEEQVHFPFLHQSANGNWYLTYRRGPHGVKGGDRVHYAMSSDQGNSWQAWRGMPLDRPELQPREGSTDSLLRFFRLREADGTLLSHRYVMENHRRESKAGASHAWDSYLLTSRDDGATWEMQIAPVTRLPFAESSAFWGHPVELADGTLLLGVYGEVDKTQAKQRFSNGVVASRDGGRSWQYLATIGSGLGSEGPNELDLAVLAGGDLLTVFRTGGAQAGGASTPLYAALSTDQGQHWSDPQPLTASDGGVSPQLLSLGEYVLLIYGLERRTIVAQLTTDGKTWTPQQVIFSGPGSTYVDVQPLGEGRVQLVFEESKFLSGPQPKTNRLLRAELELVNSDISR